MTKINEAQIQPASAPEPQPITDAQALMFLHDGCQRLTNLWLAMRDLDEWSKVFDQRGGAVTFGNDALTVVYFNNDLQAIIDATKQATIARLRTDI